MILWTSCSSVLMLMKFLLARPSTYDLFVFWMYVSETMHVGQSQDCVKDFLNVTDHKQSYQTRWKSTAWLLWSLSSHTGRRTLCGALRGMQTPSFWGRKPHRGTGSIHPLLLGSWKQKNRPNQWIFIMPGNIKLNVTKLIVKYYRSKVDFTPLRIVWIFWSGVIWGTNP